MIPRSGGSPEYYKAMAEHYRARAESLDRLSRGLGVIAICLGTGCALVLVLMLVALSVW